MSNSCVIHGNSCLKKNHLCPIPVHSCTFLLKQKTFTCPQHIFMSPTRAREDKDATLATPAPHCPVPNFRPRARNCLSAARGLSVPGPGTIFWYSPGVAIGVPLKTIHYSLAKRHSGAASVASLSSRARERRGRKGVHAPTPLSFCYKHLFKCNILTCKEKKNVKKLGAFKITSYLCNENVVFRHQGGGLQYR